MDRLHKGDVGKHRLLVRRRRIRHQAHGTDAVLDRVQQCQPGEDADRQGLLFRLQRSPGRDIVGERHLFR
ncbi:hypothetical protein D3C71_1965750 [compost metagenome]